MLVDVREFLVCRLVEEDVGNLDIDDGDSQEIDEDCRHDHEENNHKMADDGTAVFADCRLDIADRRLNVLDCRSDFHDDRLGCTGMVENFVGNGNMDYS